MSCFDPALASSPLWALIGGGKAGEGKRQEACSASSCSSPAPLTCSACQAVHYCSRCCSCYINPTSWDQNDNFHHILTPGSTRRLTGLLTNPAARRLPSGRQRQEADTLWPRETLHKATLYSKNHHSLQVLSKQADDIKPAFPPKKGPRQYTAPVCLGCHRPASLLGPRHVPANQALTLIPPVCRCSKCQWPVCGPECEARPIHRAECKVEIWLRYDYLSTYLPWHTTIPVTIMQAAIRRIITRLYYTILH